jgi:phosphate transport system permease protein
MRGVIVDAAFSLGFGALLLIAGFGLALLVAPYLIEPLLFSYDHPTAGRVGDFRRFITGEEGWRFEQSNSLIVGFAMGFAVIPLIYTISEDALTSVPNQLRAASLACGASAWQTTMGVVLPAAASGIFSGIVIGLGRALGETMIVVMAAGGTPVMDMQPLSGFRSLSAAIAIEMPEAPHGGTLYRVLFMGGLILFVMAFCMNTVAEIVRMRLRKRLSRL